MPRRSSILKDGETRAASRTRQRLHRSARGQGDEQQTYRGAGGASGRGVGAGQSTRLSGTEGTQRLLLLVLRVPPPRPRNPGGPQAPPCSFVSCLDHPVEQIACRGGHRPMERGRW